MDEDSKLNEYIKALRTAIISSTVLSLVAFVTLEPKIETAERYSTFDRLVVEYAILNDASKMKPPVALEYDSRLGGVDSQALLDVERPAPPNHADFVFLARARYALPTLFYENYCDDPSSVSHTFGNWEIGIDPKECATVLPPSFSYMESLDGLPDDVGPFKEDTYLKHIGTENNDGDQATFESETAIERFNFQADGPYELSLIATRGIERHYLRIANTFGYYDLGCREGSHGTAKLYGSAAAEEQSDQWDCDLGGVIPSEIALRLEASLAEYQGFAYKQEDRSPLQYHQYSNAMAKDIDASTESLPFVPVSIRFSWFLVACYVVIAFLLTWAIYLLTEIPRCHSVVPTIPSFYGIIARFGANKEGAYMRSLVSALIAGSARVACYFVPALVLILLLVLKESSAILDGIDVFGTSLTLEIIITILLFGAGLTAATLEFRVIRRVWSTARA